MSTNDQAAAVPDCDHHWIHRAQPDFPEWLGWIARCSFCGHFGPVDLREGWVVVRSKDIDDARDVVERLRRWKEEASIVLGQWEAVWEALGRPGRIGESITDAVRAEIERLRGIEVDAIAVLSAAFPTTEVPWLQEIGVAAGVSLLTAERDDALARIARVEALCEGARGSLFASPADCSGSCSDGPCD